jgi:hypothetical protein
MGKRSASVEQFSGVMLITIAILAVLYFVCRSQYSDTSGSPNQLSPAIGELVTSVLAGPITASLIGFRNSIANLIQVGAAAAVQQTPIKSGQIWLYVFGLAGPVAALAVLVSLRLGLMVGQNLTEVLGAVGALWVGSTAWTITRFVNPKPSATS